MTTTYPQHCENCHMEWAGRKAKPLRCPYCSRWMNKPSSKEKE